MSGKIRMKDIAERIGVSIVSVSKAINGKDGVGDDVRSRILEVAKELGYEIDSSDKKSHQKTIGVLVVDAFLTEKNAFYGNIHKSIVQISSTINVNVLLEIVNPEDEKNCIIPKIVQNKQIEGIIYLGIFADSYIETLHEEKLPYVFLDFYKENKLVNSVLSDSYNGTEELTKLLINKGHKNIRFVGTINLVSSITDRYLGYLKALVDNNLLESSNITPIPDRSSVGKGFRTFEVDPLPDAFVCSNDESAFYLMSYLKDKGVKIPEDVSIVGFDDSYFADLASPQLTTFKVDIKAMAAIALEQLVKEIDSEEYTIGKTTVYGEVIERDSVKAKK